MSDLEIRRLAREVLRLYPDPVDALRVFAEEIGMKNPRVEGKSPSPSPFTFLSGQAPSAPTADVPFEVPARRVVEVSWEDGTVLKFVIWRTGEQNRIWETVEQVPDGAQPTHYLGLQRWEAVAPLHVPGPEDWLPPRGTFRFAQPVRAVWRRGPGGSMRDMVEITGWYRSGEDFLHATILHDGTSVTVSPRDLERV